MLKHLGNFSTHFTSCSWNFIIQCKRSLNVKEKCNLRKISEQIKAKIVHCKNKLTLWKPNPPNWRGWQSYSYSCKLQAPPSRPRPPPQLGTNFAKLKECLQGKKSLLRKHFMKVKYCYSTCPFHSLVETEQEFHACMFLFLSLFLASAAVVRQK